MITFALASDDGSAPEPVWSSAVGRILVVDDEPDHREALTEILESRGFSVDAVADGRAALARVEAAPPHAVLLGTAAATMTGLELCRTITSDPDLGHLPVLMVAPRSDRHHRLAGIEAGADDFLYTPIDRDEVLLRVGSAVQRSRLYTEIGRIQATP